MNKTKKLAMELLKEGRFISSEFPILRENLITIDRAISNLDEQLDDKAHAQHTHTINDVYGLETELKSKMSADKTFSFADLIDVEGSKDAAENYVLYKADNRRFSFGSAKSLLGAHEHKVEDICGLDAYGRLDSKNEWKEANNFKNDVIIENAAFTIKNNDEIVTHLSAIKSNLKGPVTVDGKEIYTKGEAAIALQAIRDEIAKIRKVMVPLEILITKSGSIPWPEGVTDDTEIEIWAWAGGGGGTKGGWDKYEHGGGGGGGGYFPGEDAPSHRGGDGGNGAILLRFFL
ncbi:Bgr_08870 family protein [Bartonella sp. A05]|uniref:Bgr_08870 family protein n=1 Tax=Bartonella sp. A05 TaxID=2967261 RepID=UPI002E77E1C3|nr:Bgr_08870 family protein [Bartonella sp. A05]